MTAITDDDLRRLGFTRFTATAWRKYSSDSMTFVAVRGVFRTVVVEQLRDKEINTVVCPHIKTAERLEWLCCGILEGC